MFVLITKSNPLVDICNSLAIAILSEEMRNKITYLRLKAHSTKKCLFVLDMLNNRDGQYPINNEISNEIVSLQQSSLRFI
jgi:hypothetical protein